MAANEKYLTQSDINIESITWNALKTKRSQSGLTSGKQYRITDYTCTTTQANTRSAGHVFDIIVTADSTFTLNEVARAVQHVGDTYLRVCNMNAWKIWYCLDNDTERFAWADNSSTGRGVIYRMIDEHNNDCPYDFKNIQYNGSWGYWAYTFNWYKDDRTCDDLSVYNYENDEGGYSYAYSNIIKPCHDASGINYDFPLQLNGCVFLNTQSFDGGMFYGCHNNTFGTDCYDNIFRNDCYHNTFGNECFTNTFGDSCTYNAFSNRCFSNTFGDNCSFNTFGNGCQNNTFGIECSFNIFGNSCGNNTFGEFCTHNTFGSSCYNITFGDNGLSNTFGNNCIKIKFVTTASGSTPAGNYCYNKFDSGVSSVNLYNSAAASSPVQYYHIVAGVKGPSTSIKSIMVIRGRTYDTIISNNTSGNPVEFNLADVAEWAGVAEGV